MKSLVALVASLALGLVVLGQTTPPATSPPATTPPAKSPPAKNPPAKNPADKAAPGKTAKKEEPPPKIEGMEVSRGDRFLGLQIVDSVFKLSFYDAKKKPVAPDVARAVLRWDPKYKVGQERTVLSPGGGMNSMTSEKTIRPPYNFKLFITLLKQASEGEDPVGETIVVDFKQ
ncbi:MAG TPA: hypothetical protein VM029_15540 [Opitutaceae bacterium]|nr:hypothetical protein [Opitutaceae bacterium]